MQDGIVDIRVSALIRDDLSQKERKNKKKISNW
jgi:hypothetical protein